jgi:hypothetical protein
MKYIIVVNVDYCLRKKNLITILIIEIKSEEYIYKMDIVKQLTPIF